MATLSSGSCQIIMLTQKRVFPAVATRTANSKSTSSPQSSSHVMSNLSPDGMPSAAAIDGDDAAVGKPAMIDIGGQMVPLSTISIGVVILIVFTVIWRAVMTFSASLIRLTISLMVLGGFVVLSSASDKQSISGSNTVSVPISTSTAPVVDQSALDLLEQYRRQHYQQASYSR